MLTNVLRIWYEPSNEIYYDVYRKPKFKNGKFTGFQWMAIVNNQMLALEHDCIKIMRNTYKKDKLKVEIYENDYVTGMNRLTGKMVEHEVTFLNGCFMFRNWKAHEYFNKHTDVFVSSDKYKRITV